MSEQSIQSEEGTGLRGTMRSGSLPTPGSEPLVQAAAAHDILSQLGETEDDEALSELQDLLVGKERHDIDRLEGAVTGFISSMINDDSLASLVESMVKESVARRVVALHGEMDTEAGKLVVSAFRRELAIKRADMPDMVAPFLGHAIGDAIDRSQEKIRSEVGKTVRGIISREVAVHRGDLPDQIRPLVKNTVVTVARQVLESLSPEAEAMVAVAVEKEIATQRGELTERVTPYVEDAIGRAIRLADDNLLPALEPILDEKLEHLIEVGKQLLARELGRVVLPEVRNQLLTNQERLMPMVNDTVEELASEGIRTAVGKCMADYTNTVRKDARALRRSYQVIVALGVAVVLLALSLWAVYSSFDYRLQKANDRLLQMEGVLSVTQGATPSDNAGKSIPTAKFRSVRTR